MIPAGKNCRVSGWGATEWRGFMPAQLQKANVSIVHRNVCNASYASSGSVVITYGMVCANGLTESGKIIDVCQGGKFNYFVSLLHSVVYDFLFFRFRWTIAM